MATDLLRDLNAGVPSRAEPAIVWVAIWINIRLVIFLILGVDLAPLRLEGCIGGAWVGGMEARESEDRGPRRARAQMYIPRV